jgi:drug/metabolite transporter (DMT)-like permease
MKSGNINKTPAILGTVLATTLFSSGGLLVKMIAGHPLAISGLRSLIAIPILLVFLRKPRFNWSLAQIGAALAYAGVVVGFVVATKLTTAANAVILQYTSPIFVALLAMWILREEITWTDWLTIAVVMGGIVLFFLDKVTLSGLTGNLLAVGTGISFAVMLVLLRKQKKGSLVESIILGNIIAALVGVPFMIKGSPHGIGWLWLAVLGVFQLGLPFALYTWTIRMLTAIDTVIIKGIEPILNPIWVFLFIGEKPGPWSLAGAVIVFAAVTARSVLTAVQSRRAPADSPVTPRG